MTPKQADAATRKGVRVKGIRVDESGEMQRIRGRAILSQILDVVRRLWGGVTNPLHIGDAVRALIDLLKLPVMVGNAVHILTEDEGVIIWLLACDPDVER